MRRGPSALAVESLGLGGRAGRPRWPGSNGAWPAVGEFVAAHATPLRERAGTLTVYCAESVWAQEVALMAVEYVAAVNREWARRWCGRSATTATPR